MAPPQAKPTIAVGAVVVDAAQRVLLVRRGKPPGKGDWTLPGGRVETGEALAEAAAREVREETGIEARVVCALEVVAVAGEGFAYEIHEHLLIPVAPVAAPVAGDDADEARWVEREALEALGVRAEAVAVIDHARSILLVHGERLRTTVLAMRSTHVCPKCGHREILFVPRIADRDDRDQVRPMVLHVTHLDWKDVEVGAIQAYVCRGCGFTELYTENAASLDASRIPDAQLLRAKE